MRLSALLALVAACTPAGPADRTAVVLGALASDNERWVARAPELVAGKYRRMQADVYAWMRGTASLYWLDLTAPGATPTAFGDGPSSRVLLIGDPHPENLGSFRGADGTMFVDWNDFDAAGHGPYWGDVRRWAVACVLAAGDTGEDPAMAREIAATAVAGYVAAITASELPGALGRGAAPTFDALLDDAEEDGDDRVRLDEYAPFDPARGERALVPARAGAAGARRRLRGHPDRARRGSGPARPADRGRGGATSACPRATPACSTPPAGWAPAWPATRRTASTPCSPAPAPATTTTGCSSSRRAATACASPACRGWRRRRGRRSAARAVAARSARPRAAPTVMPCSASPSSAWCPTGSDRTGYQRNLDAGELAELAADDFAGFRRVIELGGAALAGAHGRAPTADGRRGHDVIAPRLRGHESAFIDETVAFAVAYAQRVRADFAAVADLDLLAETTR
ncbi:MAG: DUF2252 family protein [Kofleriaceae bacterium]